MDLIELLDKCRGDLSKSAFARHTGISLRMLTAMYAGDRRPGRRVLRALVHHRPDMRQEILDVFLPGNGHRRASQSTIEPASTADTA